MKYSLLIKLNFLVIGLVLVIFFTSKLRSGGLGPSVAAVMGLPATPPASGPVAGVETQLDWCDTRVKSIERPGQPTLEQQKLKWIWLSEPRLELNFIAVEKWFGQYCRLNVQRLGVGDFDQTLAKVAMTINFIKGSPEALLQSANGVYRWREEIFRSSELDQALAELGRLPEAGSRTTN